MDWRTGWIGINTNRVNEIVTWAVSAGQILQLKDYPQLDREPRVDFSGFPSSRFDLLLSGDHRTPVYVEVKNTTLLTDNVIRFPDAVTSRGRKHLELLARAVRRGFRGVLLFALNRPEGRIFEPAWAVDRQYCDTLLEVHELGVEILVVRLRHTASGVEIAGSKLVSGRSA